MKNSTKKLLSFALAGTVVAGANATVAHAADMYCNPNTVIEQTCDDNAFVYTVEDGDTLGKIAERFYGNSGYWEQLAAYNHMQFPSRLSIGDKIVIPSTLPMIIDYVPCTPTTPTAPAVGQTQVESVPCYPADGTYTVQEGDTLYCIVRVQYGLTNQEAVDKLATYNGLSDPNRISAGQVLLIPCVEKLQQVKQNDYTEEYNRMGWILNHPNGCKPCEPKPCDPKPCDPWFVPNPCYNPCYPYGTWVFVQEEPGYCPSLHK